MFKNVAIIITFFSLWLSGYFEAPSQQFLAFILIFSVGILHGSNDLAIISKWKSGTSRNKRYYLITTYILTVLVAASLFYLIPLIALVLFILLSSYHFGEQHWAGNHWCRFNRNPLFLSAYGLSILLLLFYLNLEETSEVIYSLTGYKPASTPILWGFGLTMLLWTLPLLYSIRNWTSGFGKPLYELFLLIVFAIVFETASLIWAFAIYFIYWHSIPSIMEQLKYLYGSISWRSFLRYFKSAGLIWMISLASLTGVYYLIKDEEQIFVPLFFAFLGAITIAHTVIMSRMFNSGQDSA